MPWQKSQSTRPPPATCNSAPLPPVAVRLPWIETSPPDGTSRTPSLPRFSVPAVQLVVPPRPRWPPPERVTFPASAVPPAPTVSVLWLATVTVPSTERAWIDALAPLPSVTDLPAGTSTFAPAPGTPEGVQLSAVLHDASVLPSNVDAAAHEGAARSATTIATRRETRPAEGRAMGAQPLRRRSLTAHRLTMMLS